MRPELHLGRQPGSTQDEHQALLPVAPERFPFFRVGDRTVHTDGRVEVSLPEGGTFAAIYGGVTPEKGLLRVSLEYGDFRTKVRIHDGGVFFQAGKKVREGTLVIAIKAELVK